MYSRDFIKNQRKRPMFLTDEKINFFKRVLTKFWITIMPEFFIPKTQNTRFFITIFEKKKRI